MKPGDLVKHTVFSSDVGVVVEVATTSCEVKVLWSSYFQPTKEIIGMLEVVSENR
tara:strand:- start:24 stop:188 length:165 start_codon:yes stop_codon:yes gene_type:complete